MTISFPLRTLGLGLFAFGSVLSFSGAAGVGGTGALDWDAIGSEAVQLLSQYLKIDTTNPPGNEMEAARFFKAIFDREGIESQIFESAPGRGNVYARLRGDRSKGAIILLNHMDVVPADRRFWTVDPFGGMVKDGYVWGRGALDMKGMGILELVAMLALKRQGVPLKRDIIFLGTADEEAGGRLGAGFMVEEHFDLLQDAEFVVNEGGWIWLRDGRVHYYGIAVSEKAPLWLRLKAVGTPGHGSTPRPGSAVNRLVAALDRVIRYETPLRVVSEVERFYRDLAELQPPPLRERYRDLQASLQDPAFAREFTQDPLSNARVRNTISVTMLEGSNKVNVIPPEASAQLDCRLLPGESPEGFIATLKQVINDDSITIEPILSFPQMVSPIGTELFQVISDVIRGQDPQAVVTTPLLQFFTDCHYFRERGIHCYSFIPMKVTDQDLALFHGNDERVSVENIRFGVRMLYEILRKAAGP